MREDRPTEECVREDRPTVPNLRGYDAGCHVTGGRLWSIARVTITYHDIAGRKYASIFDWVHNRGWHMVEVMPGIDRDLHDLEGYYRSAPANSTLTASEDGSPVE